MTLFAKVKEDQVVSVHMAGTTYVDEYGTRFPSTIWSIPNWLKNNGFIEVSRYYYEDKRFYKFSQPTYVYDKANKTVNETVAKKDRAVNDIKKTLTRMTKEMCKAELTPTNFYVTRHNEDSDYIIPDDIKANRAAIYAHLDECNLAIIGAKTNANCLALLRAVNVDAKGKETVTGTLWNWPILEEY